jgi:hypothetical protein
MWAVIKSLTASPYESVPLPSNTKNAVSADIMYGFPHSTRSPSLHTAVGLYSLSHFPIQIMFTDLEHILEPCQATFL